MDQHLIDTFSKAHITFLQNQKQWIEEQVKALGDTAIHSLVQSALTVRENAYPAYSHFPVGAAILSISGKTYASCNAEVVSWSETDHAEQSTVTKAISEGEVKKNGRVFIRAVAVAAKGGASPCGRCRQVMAEHADNALIILADDTGKITTITSLLTLLPLAFTPKDLT